VTLGAGYFRTKAPPKPPPPLVDTGQDWSGPPLRLAAGRALTVWWEAPTGYTSSQVGSALKSNIHPADYLGPQACKECHAAKYRNWSTHPHRWMNALASAETVRGDFSGVSICYRGGRATFERHQGTYRMHLERSGVQRTYQVFQTVGSRFFQYYVGKLIKGPEPSGHRFYTRDHLLPFGYWLDQKEWVPVVHVGPEKQDTQRLDPFDPPDSGPYYADYAFSCNYCHTTFPLGDLFGRRPLQMGAHAPVPMHWSVKGYMVKAHPDELPAMSRLLAGTTTENPMSGWDAPHYAVTLGVSCEACHLGTRAHVQSKGRLLPEFFPSSPYLFVETAGKPLDHGRTHDNVNWACSRCHTGKRPRFAAGMATWNSVEYADAMRGGCYSKLRCVDCHNPHKAIGPKWSFSADRDDGICLKCHGKYRPATERLAHTHHPAGSAGDHCLNCHMPRINEGLEDLVRTHMIYSPTQADMIEANHPNACNLCHTQQPIDWTLQHLKDWYGRTYEEKKIAANYPRRSGPVAPGWLKSDNEAVRLVGADALFRKGDVAMVPHLLAALDDPYLINRQFATKGLQEMLGVHLVDFGYRFYQSQEERRESLPAVRAACLGEGQAKRDLTLVGRIFNPSRRKTD
jgi:predicted CXXCH cytochrome family protein